MQGENVARRNVDVLQHGSNSQLILILVVDSHYSKMSGIKRKGLSDLERIEYV